MHGPAEAASGRGIEGTRDGGVHRALGLTVARVEFPHLGVEQVVEEERIEERGHSCPRSRQIGGLENPPSFAQPIAPSAGDSG